jgi:TonB-dependent SusC/RagA subfamily outer membrane receptor
MTPRRFLLVAATLLLADLLSPAATVAQEGTVRGVVRDEVGNLIANANVVLRGTEIGTITDSEGRFTLTAEPGTYRIEASLIGFSPLSESIVLEAGETVTVELVLIGRPVPLEELVTTVAATEGRRVERGHDIGLLNVESELQRAPKLDFSDVINSTLPGVNVTQASGEPGTASQVRVRAATSLTQDNTPLIYLDGIRVSNETGAGPDNLFFIGGQTTSRLNDINPQDIVSVQVAKGPTASALYGVEAAAGVLIIETKQGRGGPQYTFMAEGGASYDPNQYQDNYINLTANAGVTDPNDPAYLQWRPVQNPVTGEVFGRDNPLENPNTSPFRTAGLGRFFVSAAGGGSLVDFYLSGSYENIQGTLPVQGNEKFTGRVNVTFKPVAELDVAVNNFRLDHQRDSWTSFQQLWHPA